MYIYTYMSLSKYTYTYVHGLRALQESKLNYDVQNSHNKTPSFIEKINIGVGNW